MVGLVEDEQGAGAEFAEEIAEAHGIVVRRQQAVGDDEARAGAPRVDRETALAPDVADALAIHDLGGEAELGLQFVAPLDGHRRRRGDQDEVDAPAQKQFARDEAGLDGLAEADVVGDQEVHARETEGLAKGEKLIGVQADAGAERRLKKVAIGGGGGAPADGAEMGGQDVGLVRKASAHAGPAVGVENPCADFGVPDHLQRLALGVVGNAGEAQRLDRAGGGVDRLDQPRPPAHLDEAPLLHVCPGGHVGGEGSLFWGGAKLGMLQEGWLAATGAGRAPTGGFR